MGGVAPGWPMPAVGAPLDVIKYYNRGDAFDAFQKVGYFTYKDVLVFEEGKEEEIQRKLARSTDIMPQVTNPGIVREGGEHTPSSAPRSFVGQHGPTNKL